MLAFFLALNVEFSTNFDSLLYLDFSSSLITFSMYFFLHFMPKTGKQLNRKGITLRVVFDQR